MSMTPPVEAPPSPPKRTNTAVVVVVILGVVGLMCMLLIIVSAAIFFPVFRQARVAARRADAVQRMQDVATATLMYSEEHDDCLPIANDWMDSVSQYVKKQVDFHSPGLNDRNPLKEPAYGIAFMAPLSAVKLSSIENPAQRALIFDSTLERRNASSGLDTLPKPPRFGRTETGGNVISFVDGHAKLVSAYDALNLK